MKTRFTKELNQLVDHIKRESKDGQWVVIKYRDVPELTGVSSYYVRKLFEMLKEHPNVAFEIHKEAETYKKPLRFKYVDKKEKMEQLVSEKNFYYLDQDEIDFVKDKLLLSADDQEYSYRVLNVCNLIASMGAKDKFVAIKISKLSDILVENTNEIHSIVDKLVENRILIDKDGAYKLKFNNEALSEEPNYFFETASSPENLVDNMQSFLSTLQSIHGDFQNFISSQVLSLKSEKLKDEELEKGHQVLQELISENQKLRQKNEKLEKDLALAKEFRGQFIENAQGSLEVLLAEIIGIVSSYAQMPAWQKDEKTNARLQKNILSAVTAAVESILKD